jgi:hypothetical protein
MDELQNERDLFSAILDTDVSLPDKLDRISELIGRGVDLGCVLSDGFYLSGVHALLLAVIVGQGEVVELLLDHGADVNQSLDEPYFSSVVCPTALHQGCIDGRLDLVQVLEASAAKCHQALQLEVVNYRFQTPFHLAVESGNLDLVEYLVLESGSRMEATDSNSNNAIHMAILYSTFAESMVELLMTSGGIGLILQKNLNGHTPIRLASLTGKEACFRMILDLCRTDASGLQRIDVPHITSGGSELSSENCLRSTNLCT